MRLVAKGFFVYYVAGERFEARSGESIDVPADLGGRLLADGVVDPAPSERAVKPSGHKATTRK